MQQGISTHIFLPERLSPTLLQTLAEGGAQAIEVFASRHHFAYTDRKAVRELANWFRSSNVAATMHMPLFTPDEEAQWSRHTAASLNLIDANKSARIAAMDEVKRALEAAEQVPFRSCVLHLGLKEDEWDTRALDDSMTSLEHLNAFAAPLGVRLLLENLNNEVATPAHLVEILRAGHFETMGFCLDIGHANLAAPLAETSHAPAKSGIDQALEAFSAQPGKLAELHLHDNGGMRDEHCWPGQGGVDWTRVATHVAGLSSPPLGMLEIGYEQGAERRNVVAKAAQAWRLAGLRQGEFAGS